MAVSVVTQPLPCKICKQNSSFFGSCDFNRISSQDPNLQRPLSGIEVNYFRCPSCEFIFTDYFDQWSTEQFAEQIYNDEYTKIDPEYVEIRPTRNAGVIANVLGPHKNNITLLDYGGGNGRFAEILRQSGFYASTYDKFSKFSDRPTHTFDFMTCFEVMEHSCFPHECVQDIASLISTKGTIIFSTLLQPENIQEQGTGWWYIGPRNGHVSIFSKKSLKLLFKQYGFAYSALSDVLHMATRNPELISPV